eukprot:3234655-Pleurochrysis_carterae.AAC.1
MPAPPYDSALPKPPTETQPHGHVKREREIQHIVTSVQSGNTRSAHKSMPGRSQLAAFAIRAWHAAHRTRTKCARGGYTHARADRRKGAHTHRTPGHTPAQPAN